MSTVAVVIVATWAFCGGVVAVIQWGELRTTFPWWQRIPAVGLWAVSGGGMLAMPCLFVLLVAAAIAQAIF